MIKVVGIGAGGHAKVVIDILNLMKEYELVGLLDPNRSLWETTVLGVPIIGDDSLLIQLQKNGVGLAFIGVGSAADTAPRKQIYQNATANGFKIVDAIHPTAVIASSAKFGSGTTVMAGAIINPGTELGDNVIINTSSVIEHDCMIRDHAHIATGARLAGTVTVGQGAHVGVGAVVRQGLNIGEHSIVGAGAVVVKDVEPNTTVVGVPARVLMREESELSTSYPRVRL